MSTDEPDICHVEGLIPKEFGDDAVEVPGARTLLDALTEAKVPWGVVTSGTRPLVTGWLEALKLPMPNNLVTAEDVENGKPDPRCYLMGKEKTGLKDVKGDVLVVEDAPAGIRAGKAAGCKVLGLVTTHTYEQVVEAGADWVAKDLSYVKLIGDGTLEIRIYDGKASADQTKV
jgi:glycerol 3-phosphatase-1